ncbi:MAG: hypothetical protein WAX04_00060 [Oscillospiraceae bacterium]
MQICKSQPAEVVAESFQSFIFANFGNSTKFYSDRAAAFLGRVMQILEQTYGIRDIRHVTGSSRHANSQGKLERVNAIVIYCLRTLPDSNKHWELYISSISVALKTLPSKALVGYCPAEVAFGKVLRLPEQQHIAPLPFATKPKDPISAQRKIDYLLLAGL